MMTKKLKNTIDGVSTRFAPYFRPQIKKILTDGFKNNYLVLAKDFYMYSYFPFELSETAVAKIRSMTNSTIDYEALFLAVCELLNINPNKEGEFHRLGISFDTYWESFERN